MQAKLYYFNDCPSYEPALENLKIDQIRQALQREQRV